MGDERSGGGQAPTVGTYAHPFTFAGPRDNGPIPAEGAS